MKTVTHAKRLGEKAA
jgi:hypothetical protein